MSNIAQRIDDNLESCERLIDEITQDLSRLDNATLDQRNRLEAGIEKKLADIDSKIDRMTADLRSVPESSHEYYDEEIRNIRTMLSKAYAQLKQKRQANLNDGASRQSAQVASNNARSRDIVSKLDEAIRDGNETNMIGNETLVTLHEDRNTISDINSRLLEIDDEAEQGQSRAKRMLRRAFLNGCIAWTIVVILVFLLGFSLIYKFYIRKHN